MYRSREHARVLTSTGASRVDRGYRVPDCEKSDGLPLPQTEEEDKTLTRHFMLWLASSAATA